MAGSNDFGVTYTLDGAPNSNVHDGTGLHLPFPDALQEFRLTTGAQEASSGLRSGASVSAVTRSGTNVLHGSLFEFNRDSRFSSPDFFSNQKDGLKRNQFGGTIGGPIQARPGVLLRRLPGHDHAADAAQRHRVRADGGDDGRRLQRLHVAGVQRRARGRAVAGAIRGQPASGCRSSARRRWRISRRLPTPLDECGRVFTGIPNTRTRRRFRCGSTIQGSQAHSFFGRYMLTTDAGRFRWNWRRTTS